ncbi:MAG: integrase family protein [Gammaproteobacteria bacterium]|jgi:site-specific recombinase XerD|nr:integrase family protein [Gammaproteobacteria bacterium]
MIIKPLFLIRNDTHHLSKLLIHFSTDNYNKAEGLSLLDAKNDAEAISAFLNEFRDSPLTLQSYAKEIERLLLWCIHIAKINISSLRRNHLVAYQEFLKDPQPKKIWCGPRVSRQLKNGAINPAWRSFNKGLSATTLNKTITILDSFFNYLVQTNYLTGNPLAVDRRRKKRNRGQLKIIDRYLELDEIHAVLNKLADYSIQSNHHAFQIIRARYIILLLFYTGLRIAEAAHHTMGSFVQRENQWFLRVQGKGKKWRDIPVPDELLKALAEFRLKVGLPSSQPQFKEKTPLIPMKNLTQSITTRRIDQILKWAFNLGATHLECSHPAKASKLRSASAHWLRHSYVTYLLDSGASLKVAQENAGHTDIGTTMHYRHIAQTDRHAATRTLSLLVNKRKKK